MSDYIIRATAAEGQIRAFAATTRELTEFARQAHNTSPVATAALGWPMAQVMTINHDVFSRSTVIRAGQRKQRPCLSFLPLEIVREVKRRIAGLHHRIIDAGAGDLQPCDKLCVL